MQGRLSGAKLLVRTAHITAQMKFGKEKEGIGNIHRSAAANDVSE